MVYFSLQLLLSSLIGSLLICELLYPYKRAVVYSLTASLGLCFILSTFTDNLFFLSLVTIGTTFLLYIAYRLFVRIGGTVRTVDCIVLTDTPPNGTALVYRMGSVQALQNRSPYTLRKGEVLIVKKTKESEIVTETAKEEILYHV